MDGRIGVAGLEPARGVRLDRRDVGRAHASGRARTDGQGERGVGTVRAEEGGDWPMVEDRDGRVALDFGVSGVPESFLIDPDGRVTTKIVGGIRYEELERLLETAEAGTGG